MKSWLMKHSKIPSGWKPADELPQKQHLCQPATDKAPDSPVRPNIGMVDFAEAAVDRFPCGCYSERESMKVHLLQIPQGETLHLEGEEPAGGLDLAEAGAEAMSPLSYSLDIGRSEEGLFATGRLEIRVCMQCVKCLEPVEFDVVVNPFSLQMELTGREQIDLTPYLREDIHLLLPPHPKCDAGAVCSAAGATSTGQQPPERAGSAWDALDKLK